MIEQITAKNYKAFPTLNINLSKINLFFGPNNSGKSSVLSVLSLLSQTLSSSDFSVPLLLGSSSAREDFGSYRDLIYKHNIKRDLTLGLKLRTEPLKRNLLLRKRKINIGTGKIEVKYGYRPKRHEVVLNAVKLEFPDINLKVACERDEKHKDLRLTLFKRDGHKFNAESEVHVNHFLPDIWDLTDTKEGYIIRRFNTFLEKTISRIGFIGPFREPARRTYMFSGENPISVGIHGEHAIDIMTMDYFKEKKYKKNIVENVSHWFKSCSISDKLKLKPLTDRHYEIVLSRIQSKSAENIADVGSGCSQILPILVSGYNSEPGDILVIQEPEIHLHPKAQAELGSFFYELAEKGVQTIIETHSEHLLLRLQAHIADPKSSLKPEDVNIYHLSNSNGEIVIKEVKLGHDGLFEIEWPNGFFPERYLEVKKIAKKSLKG